MTIFWAESALVDIEKLRDRISLRSSATADRFIGRLIEAVEKLSRFPEIGRRIPKVEQPDLREINYRKYRIIYRLETSRVVVLTVVDGRRNISRHGFDRFDIKD